MAPFKNIEILPDDSFGNTRPALYRQGPRKKHLETKTDEEKREH